MSPSGHCKGAEPSRKRVANTVSDPLEKKVSHRQSEPTVGKVRIASSRMLPEDSAPMTGAASPNQVGGADGKRDQHGRTARVIGGGGEALPYGGASASLMS